MTFLNNEPSRANSEMLIKNMRILYLITSAKIGGTEKMLYELATRLDKENFEILICTLKGEGELLQKLREKKINTATLNINSKWQFFKVWTLIKIIKKFRPDIIQSFLFFDNILARIFGRLCKVPFIISGQRNVEIYRSSLRNFIDRISLPLAHLVITNTKAGKKILIEREKVPASKIKVIPNGVNLENIPPILSKNEKRQILFALCNISYKPKIVLGFVGHLTKQKGLEYALKALAQLRNEIKKNIVFLIIGDGLLKNQLEKLCNDLEIKNKVYFLGYKKDALNYMRLFDVFILPSLWEGQPNVILEAMSLSLPIIATDVGGVPEIIENNKNGILVPAKDIEKLRNAIELLIKHEELRKFFSKKVKESIKNFDLRKTVFSYRALYLGLMKSLNLKKPNEANKIING